MTVPSITQITVLVALGVDIAFASLALSVAALLRWPRRWVMLAVMGGLEGGYCASMVLFNAAPTAEQALFWVQLMSVFMPYMTWLVTELTVSIAALQRTFLARFSRLTLILTVCFSAAVAFDIVAGQRLIFTLADSPPGALRPQVVRATALGALYLMFVNVALYTSAVYMFRHYRKGHRELLPLLGGFIVYFVTLTNDFNLVFGLYSGPSLQHFGFLALYAGFCVYHGLDYLRSARELEAASLENQRYRDRLIEDERVRSLGLVGAFVSHEINNLLQIVIASASLLERRLAASASAGAVAALAHDLYEVSGQIELASTGLAIAGPWSSQRADGARADWQDRRRRARDLPLSGNSSQREADERNREWRAGRRMLSRSADTSRDQSGR